MDDPIQPKDAGSTDHKGALHPFRVAVLRGLGVVLPPLLTIVIFLWIGGTIDQYVVVPLTNVTRNVLAWAIADVRAGSELPETMRHNAVVVIDGIRYRRVGGAPLGTGMASDTSTVIIDGVTYRRGEDAPEPRASGGQGTGPRGATVVVDGVTYHREPDTAARPGRKARFAYVPEHVYDYVQAELRDSGEEMPKTAIGVYRRYVEIRYLGTFIIVLFFTPLFVLVLYLLGKFMAAGIGRVFWNLVEGTIRRVPLVSNVYAPVKQVSDFLLNDRDIRASRVVAVEWPRRGIWSLGLVTGESMCDIEAAANEPVYSVLICTSPMPMTGFTVTVRRSETVDLNITIDQAFQFIISCGVAIPTQQLRELQAAGPMPRLTGGNNSSGRSGGIETAGEGALKEGTRS